jgi:signal transduction histidine kinase/CheY-like chemotaxis protein
MERRARSPQKLFGGKRLYMLAAVIVACFLAVVYFLFSSHRTTVRDLTVATDHSPPFQIIRPDGQTTGVVVEALNMAAKSAGIRLHWKHMEGPPERALTDKESGVDLWPMVIVTEERKSLFHMTQPVGRAEYQLATIDTGDVDIRSYQPRKIAITEGIWRQSRVQNTFPSVEPVMVKAGEHLEAVCDGRADALITDAAALYSMAMAQLPVCSGKRVLNRPLPNWHWDLAIASTFERAAEADLLRAEFGRLAREGYLQEVFEEYPVQAHYRSHDTFAETNLERQARITRIGLLVLGIACIFFFVLVLTSHRRTSAALMMVKQKSEFLDRISHELRTPLNGVLGLASLLATTPLSLLQQDYVRLIRQSGEELLRLVSDLLDLSRLQSGKHTVQMESVDIRALVEDTVAMLAPVAESRNIDLAWLVARDVPEHVTADGRAIRQVLINLLANALKYTPKGKVRVSMEIAGKETAYPFIHCCVDDSGPGIPKNERSRVFDSFIRLDRASDRAVVGTGLGLTIARELVLLMHGNIGVTESPFGGARFWFEFPVPNNPALPEQRKERAAEHGTDAATPSSQDIDPKDENKKYIPDRVLLRRIHVVSLRPNQFPTTKPTPKQNTILRLMLGTPTAPQDVREQGNALQDLTQTGSAESVEMLSQYLQPTGTEVLWSPSLSDGLREATSGTVPELLIISETAVDNELSAATRALRDAYQSPSLPVVVFCNGVSGDGADPRLPLPFVRTLRMPFVSSRFDNVVIELMAECARRKDDAVSLRALWAEVAPATYEPATLEPSRTRDSEGRDRQKSVDNGTSNVVADMPMQGVTVPAPGLRALVADDNRVNQVVLRSMLERLGITSDVVGDGLEAVKACAATKYDYVFLDHQMPNLDGLEAAQQLRKSTDWRKYVPIIISSAADPRSHEERYRAVGIDAVLPKPFTFHELSAALEARTAGTPSATPKSESPEPPKSSSYW